MSQRYCAQCKNESSRMTSVKCVNLRTFWRISWGIVWGIVYFKFYPRGFSFSTFDYRYFELIATFNGKYKLLEPQKCPHNPEVVGSSPASATKSVTVVDTISTTVIFYLFPFWGCFWKETGDISNISGHKQIVCPDLMRPWSEKTGLGKMTIVIRI